MTDPTGPARDEGFSFGLVVVLIVAIAAIVAMTLWA